MSAVAPAIDTAWVALYTGADSRISYAPHGRGPCEFDCWGLARWVLSHHFGVGGLPVFGEQADYRHPLDGRRVPELFERHLPAYFREVCEPQPGDLIVLREGRRRMHCGVVTRPEWMLHITCRDVSARHQRYTDTEWINRIEGFWRAR